MYSSFSPGYTFNGLAYVPQLNLSGLILQDQLNPFQIYQGPNLIFSLSEGQINITGNLNITGTLIVNQTVINTYNAGLIHLADNNPGDSIDIGIYGQYFDGADVYTGIARDSSDPLKPWTFFNDYTTEPTTVINGGNPIGDANLDYVKAKMLILPTSPAGSTGIGFTTAQTTGWRYSGTSLCTVWGGVDIITTTANLTSFTTRILTSSVADSANSTDSTASIVTSGGLSVAKNINAFGANFSNLSVSGAAIFNSVSIVSATISSFTVNTMNVLGLLTAGSISCGSSTFTSITATSITATGNLTTPLSSLGTASATSIAVSGSSILAGNVTAGSSVANTFSAYNVSIVDQLTVNGGATVNFFGLVNVASINVSTSMTASQLISSSGNNSAAANDTTASLVSSGGASILKDANIGGNVTIAGNLVVAGSTTSAASSLKITSVFAGTAIGLGLLQELIEFTNTGSISVTLPALGPTTYGKDYYLIKMSGSATLTIAATGSDTINGFNSNIVLPSGVGQVRVYIVSGQNGWYTF